MFFYHSEHKEELHESGISFLNKNEADSVYSLVNRFLKAGIEPNQIGVITPYKGQKDCIMALMWEPRFCEIEVASVDSFQGREKDFIIFSTVRSNRNGDIGFLNDHRRLNVALTRAKFGLIILGNAKTLMGHEPWWKLLTHYQEKQCLVTGPNISTLAPCEIYLEKPKLRYY